MKKFYIAGSETALYRQVAIEAEDETEAIEKYENMVAKGEVEMVDSTDWNVSAYEESFYTEV